MGSYRRERQTYFRYSNRTSSPGWTIPRTDGEDKVKKGNEYDLRHDVVVTYRIPRVSGSLEGVET